LAEAIGVVRCELEEAIEAGRNSTVAFEAGPLELEFEVVFTKTGSAEGGVKAWVVTVGGSAEVSHGRTHRLRVTLSPVDRDTRKPKLIGDIDRREASPKARQNSADQGDIPSTGGQHSGDVDSR
jgi:hypothetical protein